MPSTVTAMPIRIMIVDDNRNDRGLVRDALEQEHGGFRVTEATSRKEFEALLLKDEFDLVLSDFNILGFNGLQVVNVVREHRPHLPVIIVTGTGSEEIGVEAMKSGAADYVIKTPRHIQRLPQTILAVLEKSLLRAERDHSDKLLRESEAMYHALARVSPVGMFRTGSDGDYVYVNQRWCEITGLSHDAARGRGWLLGVAPKDRELIAERWYQAVLQGLNFNAEYCFLRSDGVKTCVLGQGQAERDAAGKLIGYIGTVTDITERKRGEEELLLLDQMKSNFIRMAAHELKTPVTVVKGFAQLALREPHELSARVLSSLNAVSRGADRIALIVNDLLDLSRLQRGKVTYNPRRTDLDLLIKEVIANLSVTVAEPALLRIVKSTSIFVNADPSRIEQVLSNLITNAVRYSIYGGTIDLSVVRDGDMALVSVQDSGAGIPLASQARIFQPFYRAHAETPLDFGGMGIGLYISKEIITGHGGKLWFESTEGKGSTFFFQLPLDGTI